MRRDGVFSAAAAVRSRLDQPDALGYSSAGTVIGLGEGMTGLQVGDRVACAGAGHAVHAEFACVPRLLVARISSHSVSFEEAAFTTVGAVALHGIRMAGARLGDVVAVVGLGLLGQLTVQALKAAGCRVIGMDISIARAELALKMGADAATASSPEFRALCLEHSNGFGADAVLITAETPESGPVNLAGEVARDRGTVIAVGTVGMDLQRKLYFGKELDFRVSRSYGPGRYDAAYEQKGRDYPIGHVRWTETRNMEAFLGLLAQGKLELAPLVTHRFPIDQAHAAYDLITGRTGVPSLAVLINYPEGVETGQHLALVPRNVARSRENSVKVGVLGAGSFAVGTLLPAMKGNSSTECVGVCAANGSHARHAAQKFGFGYCSTDEAEIVEDTAVNTVVIATRHHLHAGQVLATLRAGKHTFCEKPLCLREEELAEIVQACSGHGPLLMVGFNRRFAPLAVRMKEFMGSIHGPLAMHYRVNAGQVPPGHWTNDPEQGGGRILGEVCHFVDFLVFLAGALPVEVQLRDVSADVGDNAILQLRFANGSQGTISYMTDGDRSYAKERVEAFGGGSVAVLEDFRRLDLVRHGRKQVFRSWLRQDKGHRAEWQAFADAVRVGTDAPIPFTEIVATTLATLRALDSRASGHPAVMDTFEFMSANSYLRPTGT